MSFSEDNSTALTASSDKTAMLWDLRRGGYKFPPMRGHTEPIDAACFSKDGKFIYTISLDGTVKIWRADDGNEIDTILIDSDSDIINRVFSDAYPDRFDKDKLIIVDEDDPSILLLTEGCTAAEEKITEKSITVQPSPLSAKTSDMARTTSCLTKSIVWVLL